MGRSMEIVTGLLFQKKQVNFGVLFSQFFLDRVAGGCWWIICYISGLINLMYECLQDLQDVGRVAGLGGLIT